MCASTSPHPAYYGVYHGHPIDFLMFHHDVIPTVTAADLTLILPHHVVAGHPIYPASVYISLALPTMPAPAAFCISPLAMHVPLTRCPDNWLQAPKNTRAR